LAIAASDVEHALRPFERQKGEHLVGHGLLKLRSLGVSSRVPFGHGFCCLLGFRPPRATGPDDPLNILAGSRAGGFAEDFASAAVCTTMQR
jgi:hypothetical protein